MGLKEKVTSPATRQAGSTIEGGRGGQPHSTLGARSREGRAMIRASLMPGSAHPGHPTSGGTLKQLQGKGRLGGGHRSVGWKVRVMTSLPRWSTDWHLLFTNPSPQVWAMNLETRAPLSLCPPIYPCSRQPQVASITAQPDQPRAAPARGAPGRLSPSLRQLP